MRELLMGNKKESRGEEQMTKLEIMEFIDSNKRTALHYKDFVEVLSLKNILTLVRIVTAESYIDTDKMKPTQINLANFYGLTRQTIASYQKVKPEIYEALLKHFIDKHKT